MDSIKHTLQNNFVILWSNIIIGYTHWRKATIKMLVFSSSPVTGTPCSSTTTPTLLRIVMRLFTYLPKRRDYLLQLCTSHLQLRCLAEGFSIHVYNSYTCYVAMSRGVTSWAVFKFVVVWTHICELFAAICVTAFQRWPTLMMYTARAAADLSRVTDRRTDRQRECEYFLLSPKPFGLARQ